MKRCILLITAITVLSLNGIGQTGTDSGTSDKNKDNGKDSTLITPNSVDSKILQPHLDKLEAPNPNAADLGRFSAVQVGLFTGTAKFSVPLYELKSRNLSIPVSLEYSSNGFIVDRLSSLVGYDWTLNAGGVINRAKKGKTDIPGVRPAFSLADFNSKTFQQKKDLFDGLIPVSGTVNASNDLEPDEFTFSFLNFNGKFVFDETGAIRQIPYSTLKIESNTSGSQYSYFRITTPDGTSFLFDHVGYTRPSGDPAYPSSYYLTQIKHPNGDIVYYTYTDVTGFSQMLGVKQSAMTDVQQSHSVLQNSSFHVANTTLDVNLFCSDAAYLDKIEIPNVGSMLFEKEATREDNINQNTYIADYKLKKIKVLNAGGEVVKSFQFYQQFPSGFKNFSQNLVLLDSGTAFLKRMFLDSIQFQSGASAQRISSYIFKYNNLNQLPSRFSFCQDHWGYFNGKMNSDLAVITEVPSTSRGLFTSMITTTADRSPDYLYAQKGMLCEIIFPTRGRTTIEYEANKDYSNTIVGGCRVLRTKNYDSPTSAVPNISKYIYTAHGNSSKPWYYTEFKQITETANVPNEGYVTYGSLYSNSFINLTCTGPYHVLYSTVEVLSGENGENGRELHRFCVQSDQAGTPVNLTDVTDPLIYPYVVSNSGWTTGMPYGKDVKDSGLTLKETLANEYNFTDNRNSKELLCLAVEKYYESGPSRPDLSSYIQPYKAITYSIYSNWAYVNKETSTKYLSNGNFVSVKNFSYNDFGLLNKETLTTNTGTLETSSRYVADLSGSPFNEMNLLYMKNYPIEETTLINGSVTTSKLTTYKANGSSYVPDKVYSLETATPLANSSFTAFNGTTRDTRYGQSPEYSFDSYDTNGNPLKVLGKNGIYSYYVWAYNKTYPVAKIESSINTNVNITVDDTQLRKSTVYADIQSDVAYLKGLLNSYLTNRDYMVTLYTYKPLYGTTSQTDPAGRVTFYEYDDFGRLKLTRDLAGNIRKKHEYHYAGH